jgi:hypothetical protein
MCCRGPGTGILTKSTTGGSSTSRVLMARAPVVDEVLEVLAHADLPHQLVLVAVHAGQLTHMRKRVLQPVSQLERVNVAKPAAHQQKGNESVKPTAPQGDQQHKDTTGNNEMSNSNAALASTGHPVSPPHSAGPRPRRTCTARLRPPPAW